VTPDHAVAVDSAPPVGRHGALVDRVRQRLIVDGAAAGLAQLRDALGAERALLADDVELAGLAQALSAELVGAGPLQALLADPAVTDVMVNGPTDVWVDRGSGVQRAPVAFVDEAAVRQLAQRLASSAGRRLDDAAPFVDAVLADGTRLHAILPPLVPHTTISLRTFRSRPMTIEDLESAGTVTPQLSELLAAIVQARLGFVVSGGTGSGKTTVLGALLSLASPSERLILVEDSPELRPQHRHVVRLTTRAANIEGAGGIGPIELVRQALRMRPDRLIVGEFRGGEAMDLLAALNTGHEGGAATIHANSIHSVPARFQALAATVGIDRRAVDSQLAAALDAIVHLRREADGRRRVTQIGVLRRASDEIEVQAVWRADEGPTPGAILLDGLLAERGSTTRVSR
jgi:pilus assembly protein CpaF